VYLRWLAVGAWCLRLYTTTSVLPPSVVWLGIFALAYCGVLHALAYRGHLLPRPVLLIADLLLIGVLCIFSGGLQSPAYVYFYGVIIAAAIRYGLAVGMGAALGSTLLSLGLLLFSANGEQGSNTIFMPAFYSFLLAGLCGMLSYERQQQPSQPRSALDQSRAERLLSFHRTLAPLDLDELLQRLAEELTQLVSCRGAVVLLIDPQRKRTDRIAASSRFLIPPANELNGSLTHGVLQQMLEEGTVILSSSDQIRTQLQTTPRMQEWAQNNLIFVRLQTQYPLGCLVLADKKGGLPFDSADIHMLTLAAEDVAILIERAWELEDAQIAEHTQRDSQRKIIRAQEQERKREVEEWHVPLGEKLFQVIRDFRACQELVGQRVPELKERMTHLAAELDTVAAIGRNFGNELHPSLHAEADLMESLRDYIAGVQEQEHFTVTLEASPQLPRFSRETSLTLFRIVQEALRNIRQHAHAQNVHIAFMQEQSGVSLMITDDGQGFDVDEPLDEQYGLFYMRERVAACGGALHVSSARGYGTEIRVDFPPSTEQQIVKLKRPLSTG
jgi:signal transduction histidine kinase